ncbi:hypothetical protein [Malaciobacter marinus]|uniref:hypothetical protein n=1 Tax=Malaciobacter marinus TaxID=505249 RepID=UPI001D19398F|nr:hypothetical protein [Malaciobacter marinus]
MISDEFVRNIILQIENEKTKPKINAKKLIIKEPNKKVKIPYLLSCTLQVKEKKLFNSSKLNKSIHK